MPKRIVYTRHDRGVSVCAPSITAMSYMTCGGGRWDGYPPGFLDRQIAAQSADGVGERAAHRFVMAMQLGGLSTAEAYEVMRDRFCANNGTGCELWDVSDLSLDRWFRDAWRRSPNGGPIMIDMGKARRIQFRKIKAAVDAEAKFRAAEIDQFDHQIDLPWGAIRDKIRAAGDETELRRIWPDDLALPRKHLPMKAS